MIRVLVVDDHPVVRSGITGMLAPETDIEVCGEAASGVEAVAVVPRLRPDVVLMDLRMPAGGGADAIARLPDVPVVVLTTYQDDDDLLRALDLGAVGCLLKDAPRAELCAAVRTAASGERVPVPAGVLARMAARAEARELSPRECEVLRLVAAGRTNAEIGAQLYITESTVKTYLMRVFAKLGVGDRTAAVITAMDRGLL